MKLSPREEQILSLIAQGKTDKEIALELGIICQTVKNQVYKLNHKIGSRSRAQSVAIWITETKVCPFGGKK